MPQQSKAQAPADPTDPPVPADPPARADGTEPADPQVFTDIVLEIFRVGGVLAVEGDRLTADLGLTSARWKVLGAISLEGRALTVSQIARRMGLARQSVQRLVNELARDGLVALRDNPDHRRAPLVTRSERGAQAYEAAMARYEAWAARLTAGLEPSALARTRETLRAISRRLEETPYRPR